MNIEGSAIGYLLTIFGRTARLDAGLAVGDRTPFTDGQIDVYRSRAKSRPDWFARVPVQVKGREKKRRQPKTPTYPVELIDLRMFEQIGGVLYLVVDLAEHPPHETAYYAILSPSAIDSYLSKVPEEQKSVSIKLRRMPVVPAALEQLMDVASRQVGINAANAVNLEDLKHIESGTLYTVGDLDLSRPIILRADETDFAFDVTTPEGVFPSRVSALEVIPESYVERPLNLHVIAGDVYYTDATIQRLDEVSAKITLSESLSFTLSELPTRRDFTLNLTHQANLAKRLREMSFVVSLLRTELITIGDREIQLGDAPPGINEQLTEYQKHLNDLREIDEVLKLLDSDPSLIDLDEVTEQQSRDLHEIHRVLIRGERPSSPIEQTSRATIGVGKWLLLLVVTQDQNTGHADQFIDPFSDSFGAAGRWRTSDTKGRYYPVTAYETLDRHELSRVLNLRLGQIVPAHEAILSAPETIGRANALVLALLFAADECPKRAEEFLTASEDLTDWLIEKQGHHPSYQVNKWQIAARRGTLTNSDLEEIRSLKHTADDNATLLVPETKAACAILLAEADDAQYLVGRLSSIELDRVKSWPIWHLYERLLEAPTSVATPN